MGAWDSGSFSNDAALDYLDELSDIRQLRHTLHQHQQARDADDAACVIAACDLLAALVQRPAPDLPPDVLSGWADQPTPDDLALAMQAVQFVRQHSELSELWGEDPDSLRDWHGALEDLLRRLDLNRPYDPPSPVQAETGPITALCYLCEQGIPAGQDVRLDHEEDQSGVYCSMTLYAHRACIEQRFVPPHWTDQGKPTAALLEQFGRSLQPDGGQT